MQKNTEHTVQDLAAKMIGATRYMVGKCIVRPPVLKRHFWFSELSGQVLPKDYCVTAYPIKSIEDEIMTYSVIEDINTIEQCAARIRKEKGYDVSEIISNTRDIVDVEIGVANV